MPAAGAPIAAHDDLKHGRSPAQWLVRETPQHAVARRSFAPAAPTPLISAVVGFNDTAGKHGALGFEALAGHFQAELIESAERGQVRAGEARPSGSVRHVEVFQDERVGAFILGRPRRLSRDRRASARYTLNCEGPR